MAGRPRTWELVEGESEHKVTIKWPLSLWKQVQQIALVKNTSANALVIEATQVFVDSQRREVKPDRKARR
jgi:hypothetical protein